MNKLSWIGLLSFSAESHVGYMDERHLSRKPMSDECRYKLDLNPQPWGLQRSVLTTAPLEHCLWLKTMDLIYNSDRFFYSSVLVIHTHSFFHWWWTSKSAWKLYSLNGLFITCSFVTSHLVHADIYIYIYIYIYMGWEKNMDYISVHYFKRWFY